VIYLFQTPWFTIKLISNFFSIQKTNWTTMFLLSKWEWKKEIISFQFWCSMGVDGVRLRMLQQ